eukprot:tig00021525_g22138.t1
MWSCFKKAPDRAEHSPEPSSSGPKLPIVYSEKYNITFFGLEKLHPFDAAKYAKVYKYLIESKAVRHEHFVRPEPVTEEQLRQVHTERYLESLKSSVQVAMITEVPPVAILPSAVVKRNVLVPFQYATGGSLAAARLAVKHGWAINIGGGFHHASSDRGGGFCMYADITLAIKTVQREFSDRIRKCLIVDLDAHQGNGHGLDFAGDESVYILDMYNSHIYPRDTRAKRGISLARELSPGVGDDEYLPALRSALGHAIDRCAPDFILYNAGTDCLAGDPLGLMDLSETCIIERDEMVWRAAFNSRVPICMLLSGGYQHNNARVIADSILNLNEKLQLFRRALAPRSETRISPPGPEPEPGPAADASPSPPPDPAPAAPAPPG